MHKWHIVYQEVSEARIVLEARDEDHLAELMEEGDFDLTWRVIGMFSDIESVEYDDDYENDYEDDVPPGDFGIDDDPMGSFLIQIDEY